jgi:predicted acyl esterase
MTSRTGRVARGAAEIARRQVSRDAQRRPRRCHLAVAVCALGLAAAFPSAAAAQGYSVQTLHFLVTVGPVGAQLQCNVVGDLYRPADATAAHPDPAILTTNGFGGSKASQAGLSENFAADGYVVLSYSGLGFGGSGCPIELDDPDYDGAAASQLVTFLGGGMAATNGTRINYVTRDAVAANGKHYAFDPRVGMIGGSYGGEVQFAAAEQDPRIDAIIPIITWNDLSFSLAPNDANLPASSVTNSVTGVTKYIWLNGFFGEGAAEDGAEQLAVDPTADLTGCPNFPTPICTQAIQASTSGGPSAAAVAEFRHASVESYMSNIRVPTLLAQGENDTLFQLREAVSTYQALRAQHTPVKMIWQSWGHSDLTPAPGEFGEASTGSPVNSTSSYALDNPDGSATYEGSAFLQWFNHYLKQDPAAPSLDFSFFRPWVTYTGDAAPAYGRAPSYPVATDQNLYLSGTNALVSSPQGVSGGTAHFVTSGAGAPTSYSEISVVEQNIEPGTEPYDIPGTDAEYETAPLSQSTDVVGLPEVSGIHVSAPAQLVSSGAGGLVLFFKLYDISPTGFITLPDKLIAPVRVPADGAPFNVALPGIVHQFPAGDRIALVISSGDEAYRGNLLAGPVSVTVGSAADSQLQLPVASASSQGSVKYAAVPRGCAELSGTITHRGIGSVALGASRTVIQRRFGRKLSHGHRRPNAFCLTATGIHVAYPTQRLLRALPRNRRRGLINRVGLTVTTNPYYTLLAVRPGATLAGVAGGLHLGRGVRIGANTWYLLPDHTVTGVLLVRYGIVVGVGIANRELTANRRLSSQLLRSYR